MKKSTILGLFLCLLSLTMGAQITQKPTTSLADLLKRYESVGTQKGSISEHFSKEEQQMLYSHFNNQKPVNSNQVLKGANGKSAVVPMSVANAINPRPGIKNEAAKKAEHTPLFVNSDFTRILGNFTKVVYTAENRVVHKEQTPLFLTPEAFTAVEAESLSGSQSSNKANIKNNTVSQERILYASGAKGGNAVCEQTLPWNNMENAGFFGGATNQFLAVDIDVAANESFSLSEIDVNVAGQATNFNLIFYNNAAGLPGTVITTLTNVSITNEVLNGANFGFNFYTYSLDISGSDIEFEGGVAGTKYWMEVQTNAVAWESSTASTLGLRGAFKNNNTAGAWIVGTSEYVYELRGDCTVSGGGTACEKTVPWNTMENAGFFGGATNQFLAVDIDIAANEAFSIDTVNVNVAGEATTFDIVFYDNAAGLPGTVITTLTNVSIIDEVLNGANFGFNFYTYSLDISGAGIELEGGVAGTKYWMEVQTDAVAWESTTTSTLGLRGAFKNNNTAGAWIVGTSEYVYELIGECTGGGGGGSFPAPYCGPIVFSSNTEPITLVDFAGISNITSAIINGTPAHEDFTAISGDVEQGSGYPVALEGNTDGNFTNRFVVFIDWNQNDVLNDAGEVYEMTELLVNSTGTDGQQVIGTIDVPGDAMTGTTRMRVKKIFGTTDFLNPCLGTGFGQVEDYSINVTAGGGGGAACSQADASNTFENGYGNTNNTVEIADEIIVAADTDFEVNQLTVNLINNGGFNSVDVAFYENAGGMPGTMIGSVMTIVPTSSTVIGTAFGRDVLSVVLDIAPTVMLNGTAGAETVYWIGVETPNPVNPASDAYWETTSIPNTGTDYRVHYNVANGAWTSTLPADSMWNTVYTVSGNCEPMGGGGGGILDTAYGVNNGNFELIGFPVSDPSTVEVFGDSPITVNFENAGAIDPANPRTGYVLDNGGQFYSFSVESGFYTLLGNIPGDWVGMEFDQTSGILYAVAGTSLYTIDVVGVSATLVGSMGLPAGDLPIALAIDSNGIGYTYELVSDVLYSVDLATGAATLIGSIGFDANYGQGMCYDALTDTVYMAAFNSATFTAEWRSVNLATGATTLIGPIVTTAATTQVAWVSIGETLPPPACPEPTNLTVSNITPTTADLSWNAEPNASSGYIWYVFEQGANPVTDTPIATGTTSAGTTTATATGLAGGFSYDFYVVADCNSDGLSQYAGPITFATPPACGGKFYDTGGPNGDYQNSENVTTTIFPETAGELVTVTFTAFNVESGWDALYVYDGPNAGSPIISSGNPQTNGGFPAGGYYGTTNPGPFVSSHPTGALTFVFMSDGSVPRSGWEADVTCALSPPPNDRIVNSIDVDEIGFPYTDPAVHMPAATTEDGNPDGCDLSGANGVWYNFVAAGDGTANAMIVTPGGASSVTFYTAPDEDSVETDLVLVEQQSNQCVPGTSASIFTSAGQAYYVFVLNSGAITDIVIDGTNLGVSDNTIAGFSYYPNPTTGVLNLSSLDNIDSVSVYSLLGQRVMESRVGATSTQLDLSSLSAGTYLMEVTVNGQRGTYRVLKN